MDSESLKYHQEKRNRIESLEAAVKKANLHKLVHFLITQTNRKILNGLSSVFVHIDQNDRTLVRERITITYDTQTGAISHLPEQERLGKGNFSQYTTDIIYKNQLDVIGADENILPKTGKPQIFIRLSNYSGDLGATYQFGVPPEESMPFDDLDDNNYFLRQAPAQPPPQSNDNNWIAPIRLFQDGTTVPVGHKHLTKADRTFLDSLYEFNENYRNVLSPEEDLFKLVQAKVNVAESVENSPSAIKRLINSIRNRFSRGSSDK